MTRPVIIHFPFVSSFILSLSLSLTEVVVFADIVARASTLLLAVDDCMAYVQGCKNCLLFLIVYLLLVAEI